jgi:hypothetical protein
MSKPGAAPQDYGIPKTPALKARFIPGALSFYHGVMPLEVVLQYVETRQELHRTRTFQEEYRQWLRKHGIDFDERYVWD